MNREKIEKAGGKAYRFDELVKKEPKPSSLAIVG